jgi:hypothetical protein
MTKPRSNSKSQNWWQKQNSTIKAVIISGGFGLIVACVGCIGAIGVAILNSYLTQASQRIDLNINFRAWREVDGRGEVLFARLADSPSDNLYELATNNCFQFQRDVWEGDYWQDFGSISPSPTPAYEDLIRVTFENNTPINIQEIELRLIDFVPANPQAEFEVYYSFTGQFGGGGWSNDVDLNQIELTPQTTSYKLLHGKSYQLPENGSVIFYIPFISHTPGKYTVQTVAQISAYNSSEQEYIAPENIVIKWVYLQDVKPDEIKEPDDLKFRICK